MKILVALLVILAIAAGVGFVLPTNYDMSRSVTINAEPAAIHPWINDLRKWPEWDPWKDDDPTIQVTLGAQSVGVGAHHSWTGKDGNGELTVTQSDPQTGIAFDMAFIMDDTAAPSTGELRYEKVDGGTRVTWSFKGDCADMMPRIVAGYMNKLMQGQIATAFDRGLGKLKAKVEGAKAEGK